MEIKVPFYNVVNMFLTGFVFLGGFVFLFSDSFVSIMESPIGKVAGIGPELIGVVCFFSIAYEVGLVINRLGSIVLGKLFKRWKWIPYDDNYIKYNKKLKVYPVLSTLSREYAVTRTGITLFLLLAVLSLFSQYCYLSIVFAAIAVIYYFSCRDYAKRIVALMCDEVESNEDN